MADSRYRLQPVDAPAGYLRRDDAADYRHKFNRSIESASHYSFIVGEIPVRNDFRPHWDVTLRWDDPEQAAFATTYFRDLILDYIGHPMLKVPPRLVPDYESEWLCHCTFLAMRVDLERDLCDDVRICAKAYPIKVGENDVTFRCEVQPKEVMHSSLALVRTIMRVAKDHYTKQAQRSEELIARPLGCKEKRHACYRRRDRLASGDADVPSPGERVLQVLGLPSLRSGRLGQRR